MVNINNLSNGIFWQTYALPGEEGSGVICLNGPPARHFQPGDKVSTNAEVYVEPSELKNREPVVVIVREERTSDSRSKGGTGRSPAATCECPPGRGTHAGVIFSGQCPGIRSPL